MSKTVDEEIDLTDITRNNSTPTLISITKARREISRQLQSRVCADPHTHDHGHSYIVWSNRDWLKKRQVTSQIVPPTNPGAYGRTTHQLLKATDKINRLESGTTGGTERGQYRKSGGQNFPANGKDGTRITRRWDNDNYCWTCGFGIKHTSETCKYIKDTTNHKKEATATNTMNGSIHNLHLRA
jgi:hypothetical protein